MPRCQYTAKPVLAGDSASSKISGISVLPRGPFSSAGQPASMSVFLPLRSAIWRDFIETDFCQRFTELAPLAHRMTIVTILWILPPFYDAISIATGALTSVTNP
jgi:hypothetical protein